jgi:RNA 2',3'-cyclic 3'-phosphodiesterase
MTERSHYFIAVPIDQTVKEKLSSWYEKEQPPFQRGVFEQDLHITLVFLGGVEPTLLEELKNALKTVTNQHHSFSLTVENLGFFGQKQAPRVFWASVNQEQMLYELQKDVYQTCINLGMELEKRSYSPHITLARKYIGEGPYVEEELNKSFQSYLKNEKWNVSTIVIYKTHLKRIPKYEVVASFELLQS